MCVCWCMCVVYVCCGRRVERFVKGAKEGFQQVPGKSLEILKRIAPWGIQLVVSSLTYGTGLAVVQVSHQAPLGHQGSSPASSPPTPLPDYMPLLLRSPRLCSCSWWATACGCQQPPAWWRPAWACWGWVLPQRWLATW